MLEVEAETDVAADGAVITAEGVVVCREADCASSVAVSEDFFETVPPTAPPTMAPIRMMEIMPATMKKVRRLRPHIVRSELGVGGGSDVLRVAAAVAGDALCRDSGDHSCGEVASS